MPSTTDNVTPTTHLRDSLPYNPYSGREALDIIMKRVYTHLKEHQAFASHLSYTKFDYDFGLVLTPESQEPITIRSKGSSAQAPDDGRREAGLTIPKPTLTAGGMVDIPLQKQEAQS